MYTSDEALSLIKPDKEYPVWSPYEAFGAANAMLSALEEEKRKATATEVAAV